MEAMATERPPPDSPGPITILDLARHRGVAVADDGTISGEALAVVGLDIIGGCQSCGATLAAYNAHPSRTGFWLCKHCVGDLGFTTAAEAEDFIRSAAVDAAGEGGE